MKRLLWLPLATIAVSAAAAFACAQAIDTYGAVRAQVDPWFSEANPPCVPFIQSLGLANILTALAVVLAIAAVFAKAPCRWKGALVLGGVIIIRGVLGLWILLMEADSRAHSYDCYFETEDVSLRAFVPEPNIYKPGPSRLESRPPSSTTKPSSSR